MHDDDEDVGYLQEEVGDEGHVAEAVRGAATVELVALHRQLEGIDRP
jgi:hypothetical protein